MRIAVLMGGTSEERVVSLASGRAVVAALRSRGHDVFAVDTARGYVPRQEEERVLVAEVGTSPPDRGSLVEVGKGALSVALAELPVVRKADVVFLALHGGHGEDGRLQALFDLAGIPYTGTGYLGSAIAMDKRVSKELLRRGGVPTPEWTEAGLGEEEILDRLGLPVVVKPAHGGSTVGLTVVREATALGPAIELAGELDADVLVERFVPGRELTVAVFDGEALPPVEIFPGHEIYDYESKYTPGGSSYGVPAELEPEPEHRLRELGLRAHRLLRQGSFSRVDFRLASEDGEPYCLEGNSLPGMTATSLLPKAARAAGIEFPLLCERISELALERRGPGAAP